MLKQSLKTKEKSEWDTAVMEEHEIFVQHDVQHDVMKLSEVPKGEKMLTKT